MTNRIKGIVTYKDISEDIAKEVELFIPLWTNICLGILLITFSAVRNMLGTDLGFSIKFGKVI